MSVNDTLPMAMATASRVYAVRFEVLEAADICMCSPEVSAEASDHP